MRLGTVRLGTMCLGSIAALLALAWAGCTGPQGFSVPGDTGAVVDMGGGGRDVGGATRDANSDANSDSGNDDTGATDSGATDDGAVDSGAVDSGPMDSAVVCMGVHPIIGPPRTCNPGSCLCSGTDTCFTSATITACCTTASTCVPPASDAGVVCMGVHPIIGPPRTCNPGSCLCAATDACFTSDVVASCCAGAFACAPPPSDCMYTHPIIGPPRTCTSGRCYCGNPDGCFPMDRATRCCAVPVMCVP